MDLLTDVANIEIETDQMLKQIKAMVFKLTGSGDVERLGSLLETLSAEQLKYLLSAKEPQVNGTSALIIAARNGYTKVLKMGADPHETGTVTFDGELITRVPPLWASAAAGHLEVCKLLVDSGVNVNQTTNTNSTPLRGACYDGNLDIVKFLVESGADIEIPNRHGHTALMIASYREKVSVVRYLLSVGAQTDRTSTKGNTVLHDAAEAGNDEILRILLEAGTKIQPDDYNVTPLLSAALAGHSHLMPLLMKSANCKQKHDAWKLLGATSVDKWLDMGAAITYWKKAFSPDIRVDCSQFVKELDAVRTKVYGGFREVESLEDVLSLFGDPDAIRMQALIIRERILGDSHPDTHTYLRLRGDYFMDIGSWDRTWEMWSYILQLEQFYHHPMSLATESTFFTFHDAISAVIDEMMQPGRRQMNRNHMPSIEQVLVILERAVYEAERYLFSDEESLSEHMWTFEDRNIRSDLESLLGMCLQFVHLVSRVNLVNVIQPTNTSKFIPPFNPRASIVMPIRTNSGRSDGPLGGNLLSYRSGGGTINSFNSSPALFGSRFVSPTTRPSAVSRLSPPWNRTASTEKPSYIITNNNDRFCARAFIGKALDQVPKIDLDGLRPNCAHLKCIVRRLLTVSRKLNIKLLHIACEEKEMNREDLDIIPRIPSIFVVEKLLFAGASPCEVDECGNTPLHILLLTSSIDRHAIVKALLDMGAPLFARNRHNDTCFDLIRGKPGILRTLRIGRYLSLKQIAANVVNRNGINVEDLPAELNKSTRIF
uniref:ANK_REP_REGION domain-containing protein n=1 Tax=Globodera pallida TaxID=36090 RepID=A0A183BVA8_GLOPA